MKLGISLYPEQETLEQITEYIQLASKYGFTKIFTSMFSVEGTKEEIVAYFKKLTTVAHQYGMIVDGDVNGMFLDKLGASEKDLSIFKEMGIDMIRMDTSYMDERDAELINNKEGIKIEMSTGFIPIIEMAIKNGAKPENITTCHNFYPQRYTAPSLETINKINEYWKAKGIPVAMFISSQQKGTHGPWPVSAGLPSIEEHRDLPIEKQLKHIIAMNNVDEVLIGNAFASEEEFKALAEIMKVANVDVDPKWHKIAYAMKNTTAVRVPFKVTLDQDITALEREIMFDYPLHCDVGDCMNYMLRSRLTRMFYKDADIPTRPCDKKVFTKGDVLIVNDNCRHYHGEIQIVMKDMINDGERNYLGRIDEQEIKFLDHIKARQCFTFME